MEYFTLKLDLAKCDYAEIVAIGDLHYGGGNDRNLIRRTLDYVMKRNTEGIPCFCIILGDNLDNGQKYAEAECSPEESIKQLRQDFEKCVAAGYVLGFIEGNHDLRNSRRIGALLDLTRAQVDSWNDKYGLEMFYEPCVCLILKFNNWHTMCAYVHHGQVDDLKQLLCQMCNPDMLIAGDKHKTSYEELGTYMVNKRLGKVRKHAIHAIRVAGNQKSTKWATRKGFRPTICANAIIKLTPPAETNHKRRMKVDLETISEVW